MPTIDPTQYLMDALATLTGGLVSDIQTLILSMVVLTFLAMGFDYLTDIIGDSISSNRADKFIKQANDVRMARDSWAKGTAEYDHHDALYRRFIRRSAELRSKGWH